MHIWNQCRTKAGLINSEGPFQPCCCVTMTWWHQHILYSEFLRDSMIESPFLLTLKCPVQGTSSLTVLTWAGQTPSLLIRPATVLGFMLFSDAKSLHFPQSIQQVRNTAETLRSPSHKQNILWKQPHQTSTLLWIPRINSLKKKMNRTY